MKEFVVEQLNIIKKSDTSTDIGCRTKMNDPAVRDVDIRIKLKMKSNIANQNFNGHELI